MHVLNSQTQVAMKINEELADLALQVGSVDEATRTSFLHVDKDLEALDCHINHHHQECE